MNDDLLRRESQELLEQMQARDRERARRRWQADLDAPLSDYDERLLGREYSSDRRRREAAAHETERRRDAISAVLTPKGIVWRTDFLRTLNEHAVNFAADRHVNVQRATSSTWWGSPATRTIAAHAVTTEAAYSTFFHELGHVLSADADSRQYPSTVEGGYLLAAGGEIGAWVFAIANAMEWTTQMQAHMFGSFRDHPAFSIATPADRAAMSDLLTSGWLRIHGEKWTFSELCEKRTAICSKGVFEAARRAV